MVEIDEELKKQAQEIVHQKSNKYFNKYKVTKNKKIVIPRWASDDALIQQIENQQKKINPDAIFGIINPKETQNVKLN